MSSVKSRCNKHDIVYHTGFCPRCLDDDAVGKAIAQGIYRGGHTCMNSDMGPPGSCLLCNEEIAREASAGLNSLLAPQLGALPDHLEITPKDILRPKTSAERKGEPIHSGVLMYFPDALAAIARLSKKANDKHNPGEPMGWSRGKSTDHMDCVTRHSLTRETIDPEMGEIEAVNIAWRALAELQLLEEKRLNAAGVMPYSGVTT